MVLDKEKSDKHFPLWSLDSRFRRLSDNPKKFCSYVSEGQKVADLGCGPGYYTLALAKCVGNTGKVYAVDSDEKAIQRLEKKAHKHSFQNIEAHVSSASELNFINDGSVDFVLAEGLLCSMAPKQHELAIEEMKRILKPNGLIYLAVSRGPWSYVEKEEWEKILEGFKVEQKSDGYPGGDRWAVVNKKQN